MGLLQQQQQQQSVKRRPSTTAAPLVVAGVLLSVFVVVQLVVLTNHRHQHMLAVLHLTPRGEVHAVVAAAAATTSGPQAAADTTHASAQHHQQQEEKQSQQPTVQQGSSAGAGQQEVRQPHQSDADLEELFVPKHYRQRLAQLEAGPHGEQLLSADFAPLRISHCSSHMPQHWAPCLKIPNVGVTTECVWVSVLSQDSECALASVSLLISPGSLLIVVCTLCVTLPTCLAAGGH